MIVNDAGFQANIDYIATRVQYLQKNQTKTNRYYRTGVLQSIAIILMAICFSNVSCLFSVWSSMCLLTIFIMKTQYQVCENKLEEYRALITCDGNVPKITPTMSRSELVYAKEFVHRSFQYITLVYIIRIINAINLISIMYLVYRVLVG